jgi:hypothetical protein
MTPVGQTAERALLPLPRRLLLPLLLLRPLTLLLTLALLASHQMPRHQRLCCLHLRTHPHAAAAGRMSCLLSSHL